MTKKELVERLKQVRSEDPNNTEKIHHRFDEALLEYVDDFDVSRIFDKESLYYG